MMMMMMMMMMVTMTMMIVMKIMRGNFCRLHRMYGSFYYFYFQQILLQKFTADLKDLLKLHLTRTCIGNIDQCPFCLISFSTKSPSQMESAVLLSKDSVFFKLPLNKTQGSNMYQMRKN